MGRIQVLEPKTAALIAAGEVVTRPGSVVKELVENALDAGARHITVEIEEGGRRLLRVVDDGWGMTPEEAPLALLRHATSKIRREEDLLGITTLGFRGEALPSIAQVSRLEILTRPPGAEGGFRVMAEGGDLLDSQVAAAPPGTQVTVADLFFNTPVRRKFLKSREAEQGYILETVRHLALGYPEVQFRLTAGKRVLLAAPAAQTLLERVAAVYGAEAAENLLPLALEGGPWAAAGVLSVPDYTVASSRFQVLLVNRRVVQDRILAAAVRAAYQGLLPRGRHPVVVAYLTLPPEQVDVNVHPTKAEVRFRDPGRVYALLFGALRQGLGALSREKPRYQAVWQPGSLALAQDPGAAPAAAFPAAHPGFPPRRPRPWSPCPNPSRLPPGFASRTCTSSDSCTIPTSWPRAPRGWCSSTSTPRMNGCSMRPWKSDPDQVPRQSLLFPKIVEVSPAQADWVGDNLALLARFGLELEAFGGASFRVMAAPAWLASADLEALVLDLVERLAPVKSSASPQALEEQVRTLMACHGAIRAGQRLAPEEMAALLAQLDGSGGLLPLSPRPAAVAADPLRRHPPELPAAPGLGVATAKVAVLVGPTAVGKTAAALDLALAVGADIVNADSLQVYRELDIGTAKPTPAERARVRHHLVDAADPDEPYDAARYAREGRAVIADLHGRGVPPWWWAAPACTSRPCWAACFTRGRGSGKCGGAWPGSWLSRACRPFLPAWHPWTRTAPGGWPPATPTASSGPWRWWRPPAAP
jgi:DNA mismatch repair protein MutL